MKVARETGDSSREEETGSSKQTRRGSGGQREAGVCAQLGYSGPAKTNRRWSLFTDHPAPLPALPHCFPISSSTAPCRCLCPAVFTRLSPQRPALPRWGAARWQEQTGRREAMRVKAATRVILESFMWDSWVCRVRGEDGLRNPTAGCHSGQ